MLGRPAYFDVFVWCSPQFLARDAVLAGAAGEAGETEKVYGLPALPLFVNLLFF